MDSALAIASVTAVLKNLLEDGLVDRGVIASIGSDATVSALPPDRITVGSEERAQLNLFLYQVSPHTGLRSSERSSAAGKNAPRTAAPLALDLYYLLSAYGAQDYQGEILLGYALQLLHETPALKREAIRAALAAQSATGDGRIVPPTLAALAASSLADQLEQITVSPQFLNTEELARLWSAVQAHLRPSAVYKVSLVLIERRA